MTTASTTDRDARVAHWSVLDRSSGLLAADRDIVDASLALRTVIVEFAAAGGTDEEIYDACALLGRFMALRGGSASLASMTLDNAAIALGTRDAPWLAPSRAALAEGFTFALQERAREDAQKTWEFPRCVVPLPDHAIAVAAGYPSDDPEALREWAGRIAREAALSGVRRAFVAGVDAAREAVEEAFDIVGIAISRSPDGYAGSRT
jgi:hypothetical protein